MTNKPNIRLAFLLSLPMVVFFAGYLFWHGGGLIPTGFIQYDNASYIAYARQYLDDDHLHLQYSNPFNEGPRAAIYFQPQTFFFALLLKLGVAPGWILIPFTYLFSVICFLLLIRIYDYVAAPSRFRILHLWLLAWGGGLLTVFGALAQIFLNHRGSFFDGLFLLDPERGWWGLNLGRSLFFSCEAYYHALFLGAVFSLLKRKWTLAFLLCFLLSLSHPFTGIELVLILFSWSVLEYLLNRKRVPPLFIGGLLFILCFHLYYYLVYLNYFSDHKSVSDQYALNWRLRFYRMIPAYCLVGVLAASSVYLSAVKNFFNSRSNRLFATWFLVAFALANHELFVTPRQPVHFTRGYIWTSLFFLGIPALQLASNQIFSKWKGRGLAILAAVFLLDNFSWITYVTGEKAEAPSASYITGEQKQLLQFMNRNTSNTTLVVSADVNLGYLSAVYTKGYPWYSHPYTTPFAGTKRTALEHFLQQGIWDTSWTRREINFLLYRGDTLAARSIRERNGYPAGETDNYRIYFYRPVVR